MSTISQSIPNLLLGISQQPDNRKRPGQVKDAQNVFPDFALGMLKRPGGKFVAKLDNAEARGKWFPILRDGTEKYICQYDTTDSLFRIWNLSDGIRRVVDMGSNSGQPSGCSIPNLFTTFTDVANAKNALNNAETALQIAASDLSKKTLGQMPTLNTVFAVDFRKFSNPRSEKYTEILKEEVKSGVYEIDGNAKQSTATVSVSNEITAVGVSDGGAGYETAPTVTIAGSGSDATATATLSSTGDFKNLNITNAGLAYENEPIATLTGGLAPYCHPKVVMTGPTDSTFDDAGTETTVTSIQLNPGKQIELWNINDPDVIAIGRAPGGVYGDNVTAMRVDEISGTGSGSRDYGLNMRSPESRLTFVGGPGGRMVFLQKQDLTNVHTIRVYGCAGSDTNGGRKLDLDSGWQSSYQPVPASIFLEFAEDDSNFDTLEYPTFLTNAGPWNSVNRDKFRENRYILWEGEHPGFTTVSGSLNNGKAGNFDRSLGEWDEVGVVVPANTLTAAETRYGYKDVVVPAQFRKKDIWMTIHQLHFTAGGGGAFSGSGPTYRWENAYVTTMHLLEDLPTNVADTTITLTNNTIGNAQDSNPIKTDYHVSQAPATVATAEIITGKSVESLTLTNAGSGYNVGTATTIALSGGSPTTPATPTITVTPTFTATITEAGKGYKSATATMTGGGGSGAAPTVQTLNGLVTGVTFTGGDGNYLSDPTITLSAPNTDNPRYAETIYKKDGNVLHGVLTHVDVKKSGQGLTAASATNVATTTNGDGTGATVDLTVTNGQVHAVSINTNGTGYLTDDEIYPTGYTGVVIRAFSYAKGTERTSEHPVVASEGYRVYELDEYFAPANTAAELTAATTAYTSAVTTRDAAITTLTNAGIAAGTQGAACAIGSLPNNTLEIKNAGTGLTDGTFSAEATATTGSGANMTVDLIVASNKVTRADINAAGTGYVIGDVITLTSGAFSGVELVFGYPPYLKDANPDDIEFLTLNDYTFVLNKTKEVKMKPDLTHQTGLDPHRSQIVIQLAQNSTTYKVRLTQGGTTKSFNHASGTGASSDNIAAGLTTLIDADADYSATQVGGTVYVTSSSAFSVETRGGQTETAIYAVSDSISNLSLLPRQSKDGNIVRIVNSEDLDIDDMYVKFVVDGSQTFGIGSWEESTAPNLKYKFDPLTMPHALVRQADGKFTYEPVNWNDRLVGDDETNPLPSFVDNKISHIFFYRNRMGFLSGQNVILSRAGDLFNFWNTSALTAVNDDPIDISAAGKRPVFLHYVEPTSVGLVLYATNEQFLLATDSDILAPTSAKVNSLSAYECEANIESVSLGTTQAFISKTPLYTRLFELTDVTSEQPPLMADITNVVPELIPKSIDTMVSSPALSVVSLGTTGSSTLYQYRFLSRSRDERLVNCWYKWDLTGSLLTQFFDSSTFFTCVSNNSDVYVQSYDMTQSSEEGFLTLPTGEKTDVCLDLFDINPVHSYNSATDKTRIELPYDAVAGKTLKVVVLGGFIGDENVLSSQSVGAVLLPTIQGTAGSQFVEINGDFQGRDLIIGFNYDMSLKLPQLYRYRESSGQIINDDVSSLILHRIKVKTGLSGPVDYKISITGLADFTETVSVTQPNQYQLNNVNMQASSTHVVPVFQRNENLAIEIIGNTPFPVSLLGLDWEGKLNQRFYRRG